jgi:endo-1,4-beta-D-glucanase Y
MGKSRMFADGEMKIAYAILVAASEWQKETGGTLDDLLREIEKAWPIKEEVS